MPRTDLLRIRYVCVRAVNCYDLYRRDRTRRNRKRRKTRTEPVSGYWVPGGGGYAEERPRDGRAVVYGPPGRGGGNGQRNERRTLTVRVDFYEWKTLVVRKYRTRDPAGGGAWGLGGTRPPLHGRQYFVLIDIVLDYTRIFFPRIYEHFKQNLKSFRRNFRFLPPLPLRIKYFHNLLFVLRRLIPAMIVLRFLFSRIPLIYSLI